ncbi:MAG TPA: hypothetical protein VI913_01150 [Candidatus Peribacteraceae bacterium]|nr:hypothetical protein [Candidatus Peribacteraceae bacterium]
MPLLVLLLGLIAPRLVMIVLWLFTGWFTNVFDTFVIPVLGFIFLPYTLLWYSVVQNYWGGTWGFWQIAFMLLALALDLGIPAGSRRHE